MPVLTMWKPGPHGSHLAVGIFSGRTYARTWPANGVWFVEVLGRVFRHKISSSNLARRWIESELRTR